MVLLGWGAFLLFSRFASPRAALIGSVALMLCGPTVSLLDVSNNLTTFAWIPLVLWCALAGVSPAASGTAIAMSFLAGEPFFAAVGALLFALLSGAPAPSPAGRLKTIMNVAITAIFLAGVQLIPFLAIVMGSDRAGSVPRDEILRDSVPLSDWIRMAIPTTGIHQQFIPVVYIGILPALLAVMGIAAAVHVRAARAWLVLLVCSVVIATGSHAPLIGDLLSKLPLTIIRYPARVVPLGALALIALAAIGWDRLARWLPFSWLGVAVVALIIADLVPRIAPLLQSTPLRPHVPYARSIGRDGKIARLTGGRSQLPRFDRSAWISGYLNLVDRRFDAWTAAPLISQRYTAAYEAALQNRRQLDAMSIGYVLAAERIPALQPIAGTAGVIVHRNPTALPLAYWTDGGRAVVQARRLLFSTRTAHIDVDAPANGLVVVSQQSAPGWEVDVDGSRATPQRSGVFRAVRVNAGHHAITWRYRPRSLMIGSVMSIIAIARMLLSSRFVKRKWQKKISSHDEDFT
jgi:hypothetical protein